MDLANVLSLKRSRFWKPIIFYITPLRFAFFLIQRARRDGFTYWSFLNPFTLLYYSFPFIFLHFTISPLFISPFLFFFSGQEEIRYPNGTLQISFADGSVKRIDTDGTENINFPDGTKGQLISKGHSGVFNSPKKRT